MHRPIPLTWTVSLDPPFHTLRAESRGQYLHCVGDTLAIFHQTKKGFDGKVYGQAGSLGDHPFREDAWGYSAWVDGTGRSEEEQFLSV